MFLTFNVLQHCYCRNKANGQKRNLAAFQVIVTRFPKFNVVSQYWQNENTKVRRKLLFFNCIIMQMGGRTKFKFGENAF